MSTDSLKDTIVPKSNQLNADDLLVGPITVTVESVKRGESKEQPVVIGIGKDRMPYLPCKSMRRVLIAAWGDKGADWVGKSMTLYCDANVVFGGVKVGGIRISHLSHIESDRSFMLTATRGKKAEFLVKRLETKAKKERTPAQLYADAKAAIDAATDKAKLDVLSAYLTSDDVAFSADEVSTLSARITKREEQLAAGATA